MLQHYDERNRDLIVNVNGRLLHRDEAGVSPFESVVQGGDAVWEGLRLYEGRIFRLEEHLDRLRASAAALAFEEVPTHEEIMSEIRRTLEANSMRDGVHIRLTLSRGEKITSGMDPRLNRSGPTLIVLAEHKPPVYERDGIRLVTSSIRRPPPDVLDPKIHHANLIPSILAKIEANLVGADDALMLDLQGFIAETNATHVFVVEADTDSTPGNGIPAEVRDLSTTDAYRADEMFCTGTMGELAGVIELDGRAIGTGEVGPLTRRLSELYAAETASSGTPILEAPAPSAGS